MKASLLMLLPFAACAPSLVDEENLPDNTDPVGEEPAEPVDAVMESYDDGSFLLMLDATSEVVPVKLDLDSRFTTLDEDWEFSMVRFDTLVNDGVGVIAIEGQAFEDVVTWDDADWAIGSEGSSLLATWWDYDLNNHVLSPADIVFLFQTDEGAVFKMQFEDYYADAGTPATVTVTVAELVKEDDVPE